jgi:sorbitol/mannitol transport system permease protein
MTTTVEKTTETTAPAAASKKKSRKFSPWGLVAWLVGLGFFFPVFWMVLTSFKQESDAATNPPKLFFTPTLDQYKAVFERVFRRSWCYCSVYPPRSRCRCGRSAKHKTACSSS